VSGVRVVQVISSDSVAAAAKISVAEASVSSNEDLKTLLRDSSAKPFDLNAGSLARVILIRLPTGEKVVQVTLHQIIADYRSAGLFLRSVLDSTEFSASGELQYADFAHWERNRWVIERKFAYDDISPVEERETWQETQVGYWQTALDGSLHVLQLPTDSSRPATQNFDCTQVQYTLNAELASKVIELAKARVGGEHALFVLLASAFKVLLYRYCGEDDVIVGTTVAGRPLSSLRGLVGPFSNQLAVRSFIHDKMTFHEVVENIKTTIERGLLHQEVPFERLFEELRGVDPDAKKASTHNVLFHVKFNMLSQLEPEQIVVNEYTLDDISSSYDLELTINDRDIMTSGLGFEFVYNRNLFVADRIEEMFQQLDLLLTQIVKNFQSNIIAYNLVTDRARALVPNPAKDQDPTWRGPITEFFSKNARAEPNRIAVVYKDDQITYDVLEKATNQFASYLHRNGLQPGDVLAIYGHRSPAVVVAIMGILKAGCAYSMIDPAYPSTRIQQCCDIAKPRGWVRIENAGVPPQDLQVWLDAYPGLLQINLPQPSDANVPYKDDKDTFPVVEITADSVAVITFTSGSTGLPKGVMGRHGPLTHYYPWMAERFGLGRDDRFSMCSGIAHDPLQRDIFTPLFFGAAVYIPTQEDITTPGRLSEWMREKEISVTCMTPALGQILTTIDNPTFTIDSLRNAFFVGDMLIKRDVYRLIRLCPNIRVINMYGSTETQRSVGYFVVPNDEDELRAMKEVIPVGEGMQGCDVIILNSRMQLAGVGEVSEIYMRSHHLAKGYVGLDEQTKEKFIPNPFSGVKGDRLYKTGDLGRYAPNGLLECFGRADDQVKIRGFRIELGEINATLSLHPSVKENVTIVREDAPGEKRLVSYVVPTDLDAGGSRVSGPIDAAALSKELRGFLTKKLPNYMVPTYVVIIRAMPLTPNGKINRGGLPAPTDSVSDAVTAPPAEQLRPLTATEDKLLRVWARVLAVQVSSPEDNFFELGGHSILATRLMFEVGKELKMEKQLPMQLLFRAPTVASMAKAIDDLVAGAELSATSAAGPVIDLAKEATLEPSIDPASATPFDSTAPVKNILLTGATGFLGAFLLRGLLDQTETSGARVFCLARADTDDAAQKRLHKTLSLHLLWNDKYEHRIVPVAGDLSKPLLGLKQEKFDELARDVDVVIHNGALVHWLLPYEKLKPTNVNGTIEVLRLCSQTKQKALHHISTTSVFETDYHDKLKFVYEDDPLETFDGLTGGYGQSKWVAERLVLEAHRRGLPASIYRPGYVTGDSENGIWNTDDFLCRMIKGCIQLKAAPLLPPDATLDMSTVDYVCKTVAYLSIGASGEGLGKNYHLTNPNLYSYETLFGAVKSFGYDVEVRFCSLTAAFFLCVLGFCCKILRVPYC
jgi:L-aminoadipate-semialdehyde dehydrogenase